MKRLSVQLAQLRERFESSPVWKAELAIVDRIEKRAWKNKTPGGKKTLVLDIHQLGLDYGAGFAFDALQLAEPKALANQIARFMCIDVAIASLDAHPLLEQIFPRHSLKALGEFIGKNGDLSAWDDWAAKLRDGYLHSTNEVYCRLYNRFLAPLYGRYLSGGWSMDGLGGLLDAVDDLGFLLVRADERYLAAAQIADLARELETRWQNGTRLEFEFIGDIEQAVEELENKLAPAHRRRALGRMWSSWVFHTTGEAIRPVAPTPALLDNDKA